MDARNGNGRKGNGKKGNGRNGNGREGNGACRFDFGLTIGRRRRAGD